MLLKFVLLYWVIILLYYINLFKIYILIWHFLLFCCDIVFVLYVCIVFILFLFQNFFVAEIQYFL